MAHLYIYEWLTAGKVQTELAEYLNSFSRYWNVDVNFWWQIFSKPKCSMLWYILFILKYSLSISSNFQRTERSIVVTFYGLTFHKSPCYWLWYKQHLMQRMEYV